MRLRNEVGRDLRGDVGQGAPSTIRCIKTPEPPEPPTGTGPRQGAPSTIRCIKTPLLERGHRLGEHEVREHPAPPGALRLVVDKEIPRPSANAVREHPAPSGALRLAHSSPHWARRYRPGQGAPSTIRCIKTTSWQALQRAASVVREHPAPRGALRPTTRRPTMRLRITRQGAPSTIRCIETREQPVGQPQVDVHRQGASSTIRCIKTHRSSGCASLW